jgi:hypothetical protein
MRNIGMKYKCKEEGVVYVFVPLSHARLGYVAKKPAQRADDLGRFMSSILGSSLRKT